MQKTRLDTAEIEALERALVEYGFSLEAGGANAGDEQAERHHNALRALAERCRTLHTSFPEQHQESVEVPAHEVEALKAATAELAFSVEAGGANEGDAEVEEQVVTLEWLLARLEVEEVQTPFTPEPRQRLSDLAERSSSAPRA